jgi:hypothetical protein
VYYCHTVVAASAPFRDLPRKLPWNVTLMLTEKKREATHLLYRGEKDGSRRLAPMAWDLNKRESWTWRLHAAIDHRTSPKPTAGGRVKEISLKRRPDNIPTWGTSKVPWGIPTPNCGSGWLGKRDSSICITLAHPTPKNHPYQRA